jgi:hypothetical protein
MTWVAGDEAADPQPAAHIRPYLQAPPPAPDANPDVPTDPRADGLSACRGIALAPPGLRPFVLTSGRVNSVDPAIRLETQVTARPEDVSRIMPPLSILAPELQAIVALSAVPVSVAELSARLRLHLGVTKILVGDLRAAGHLDVHTTDVPDSHDPQTILRVIHGLRALS